MSLVVIGGIIILALFVLLFLQVPISIALALCGFIGAGLVRGMGAGLSVLGTEYFSVVTQNAFSVIPFFVGMGFLAGQLGLSADAFVPLSKFIGHVRGGLAMAAVGGCAVFAAICGDCIACAVTLASVGLPEMRKRGYKDSLSLGTLASGGVLGFMIPPSIPLIIYALITEQSVGKLFMAGILPGVILAIFFIITIYIVCRLDRQAGPAGPKVSWGERFKSLPKVTGILILVVIVLGGIYTGIFTPTEAGAVGLFGIIIMGIVQRRATGKRLISGFSDTGKLAGQLFLLMIGAIIFSRFIALTELPRFISDTLINFGLPSYGILWMILLFYLLVGCILDIGSITLICVPILHPVLVAAGFNPIHLAILTNITILIGIITPPVGIQIFAMKAYVPDVPMYTIFKGAMPFVGAMLVCLVLCVYVPQISLFLVNLMTPG